MLRASILAAAEAPKETTSLLVFVSSLRAGLAGLRSLGFTAEEAEQEMHRCVATACRGEAGPEGACWIEIPGRSR